MKLLGFTHTQNYTHTMTVFEELCRITLLQLSYMAGS